MPIRSMTTRPRAARCRQAVVYLALFTVCSLLLLQLSAKAGADGTAGRRRAAREPAAVLTALPPSLGRVIYRYNESSPKMLYIVGISHRAPDSLENDDHTVRTQAELYRIGEWLNRNNDLDLLLPEGFFGASPRGLGYRSGQTAAPLDDTILRNRLADERVFVNAEMLLMEQLQMRAGAVDDRPLYEAVLDRLNRLGDRTGGPGDERALSAEISNLQEKRTAAILQKIPEVIESEYRNGAIARPSGLFTIGLDHISTIIAYLERSGIEIAPAATGGFEAEANLIKAGFGITIIIPQTLAQDPEILQRTRLADFI